MNYSGTSPRASRLRQRIAPCRSLSFIPAYPEFKVKHKHTDSYTTNLANKESSNIRLDGDMLKLPKIKEPIKLRMHRQVQLEGTLKSVTVTHEPSGKWYFSLPLEYPKEECLPAKAIDPETITHIGLDMSLPKLYVDSNGEEADFFKHYHQLEKRKLSHMEKEGSNYGKQKQRIAKLHAKDKHQRNDMLHKLSHRLTDQYESRPATTDGATLCGVRVTGIGTFLRCTFEETLECRVEAQLYVGQGQRIHILEPLKTRNLFIAGRSRDIELFPSFIPSLDICQHTVSEEPTTASYLTQHMCLVTGSYPTEAISHHGY